MLLGCIYHVVIYSKFIQSLGPKSDLESSPNLQPRFYTLQNLVVHKLYQIFLPLISQCMNFTEGLFCTPDAVNIVLMMFIVPVCFQYQSLNMLKHFFFYLDA